MSRGIDIYSYTPDDVESFLDNTKVAVVRALLKEGFTEAELLRLAASVERASEHPLGQAIVRAAEGEGIALASVANFDSPTGRSEPSVLARMGDERAKS